MLIDTHCHINILIKQQFDVDLEQFQINLAKKIIQEAHDAGVVHIINVGTSVIESSNCIKIAQEYKNNYAVVGLHPNDCTNNWQNDLKKIAQYAEKNATNKIVGIGECGLDYHYKDYNKQRQKDAFRAQIDLALTLNLPLVIHTRQASQETLKVLDEFKNEQHLRGVFHCFSEDLSFADYAINELGFFIGIGGIITYPKNNSLRSIVKKYGLYNILLETDAPFLPPQNIRGKKNHPQQIKTIALYIADLLQKDFSHVANTTTQNAFKLFDLSKFSSCPSSQ